MSFPIYTKSGREMDYAIFDRKIALYTKNGIDGWDEDLLELIKAQFSMIKELNRRIDALEVVSLETVKRGSSHEPAGL